MRDLSQHKPYRFAILRYRDDIFREEFVNIGLIGWLSREDSFFFRLSADYSRLFSFFEFNENAQKNFLDFVATLETSISQKTLEWESEGLPRNQNFEELLHNLLGGVFNHYFFSDSKSGIDPDPLTRFNTLFEELVAI